MLELLDVSVNVGRRCILDGVSFSVAAGQVLGIVGPNGSGKTTLLRVLTGELNPGRGRVRLGSRELRQHSVADLARQRAYLRQDQGLAFGGSVLEVVLLGRTPHRARESQRMGLQIAERAMDLVEVSELAERSYLELSAGEQHRVQLARVLAQIWQPTAQSSRLLLLDEPTASLELHHQQAALAAVRRFAASGVAVVVVLRDLALAARHTDRLLLLEGGRAFESGESSDGLTTGNVRQAFNVSGHHVSSAEAALAPSVNSGPEPSVSKG